MLFRGVGFRKDTHSEAAFLTARVSKPDKYDWKKLQKLLQYIKGIIRMTSIIKCYDTNVVKWWVYAAYATNEDMCGYTGVTISLGRSLIISMSNKNFFNRTIQMRV